jgi:hypothetical protein
MAYVLRAGPGASTLGVTGHALMTARSGVLVLVSTAAVLICAVGWGGMLGGVLGSIIIIFFLTILYCFIL